MKKVIELDTIRRDFQVGEEVVHALRGVSFSITEGEFVTIMGTSGSGKSTLLNTLGCLDTPTKGEYYLDGISVRTMTKSERAVLRNRKIGFVFQNYNLLPKTTAVENVELPLMYNTRVSAKERRQRAVDALMAVGLGDRLEHKSNQMSGGQMQRVAIARALATNPKVLLCDEATSALDPKTTRAILNLLKDISKRLGITVIIITHEMAVIEEICQRVAIIDNHVIAETGTVEEVFSRPKHEATRRLIFPEDRKLPSFDEARCLRLIFDGTSAMEPVLANMIMDCKTPVNIMAADTHIMDGKTFGQMMIQVPETISHINYERMLAYLEDKHVLVEEVAGCLK